MVSSCLRNSNLWKSLVPSYDTCSFSASAQLAAHMHRDAFRSRLAIGTGFWSQASRLTRCVPTPMMSSLALHLTLQAKSPSKPVKGAGTPQKSLARRYSRPEPSLGNILVCILQRFPGSVGSVRFRKLRSACQRLATASPATTMCLDLWV